MDLRYRVVSTPAGFCGFVANERGLRRSYLPGGSADAIVQRILDDEPEATRDDKLLPKVAMELTRYFSGEHADFDFPLDVADAPEFHRKVWERCRKIGRGETLTYQQLAVAVRNPKAARAVGNAMRTNRLAPIIPCHRVVSSGGGMGGYSGPGGVDFKRQLLAQEAATPAVL